MTNIQVQPEHYDFKYDSLDRFISYHKQLELVIKNYKSAVLEIGIGNSFVSNYLKSKGYNISTCDFDKDLKPDFVADVRKLSFNNNAYNLVTCFEVLEHIPFEDFDKAVDEITRVSSDKVLISIPYDAATFEIVIKFPFLYVFNKKYLPFILTIPKFFKKTKFNGQHYWEMGNRGYSVRKIRKKLLKNFKIVSEEKPVLNSYHYFFVLEKR